MITKKKVKKIKKTVKKTSRNAVKKTKKKQTKVILKKNKKQSTKSSRKVTKAKTKKPIKKKRQIRRRRVVTLEDIYKIINYVQTKKKKKDFAVSLEDVSMIKNVLEDVDILFDLNEMKTKAVFVLHPPVEIEIVDVDEIHEELMEEGFIF
ncbi:MAG: hypothetical protein QQN41_08195 [Nitrosopumilus sp.]